MEYSMNKKEVRSLLRMMDISHTVNGGSTEPQTDLDHYDDRLEMTVRVPGAHVTDLEVELVDQSIVVNQKITLDGRSFARTVASLPLELHMDHDHIRADIEGGDLIVRIPLNNLNRGFKRGIPISR